mgnify:FL=1
MDNKNEQETNQDMPDYIYKQRKIEGILLMIRLILYAAYLLFLFFSNIFNGYYVLAIADCLFAGYVLFWGEKIIGGFISMFFL